jgi:hypothetical protein
MCRLDTEKRMLSWKMGNLARVLLILVIVWEFHKLAEPDHISAAPINVPFVEVQRRSSNECRLSQCDASFAAKVRATIRDLESGGFQPWITESWRSYEEQAHVFAVGRSKVKFGFHNIVGIDRQPRAFAVDLINAPASRASMQEYELSLWSIAKRYHLTTGLFWGLNGEQRLAVRRAIDAPRTRRTLEIGWDPCHLEPAGTSLGQILESLPGSHGWPAPPT